MTIPTNSPLFLGLAMWSHNQWQKSLYGPGCKNSDRLARYAEVFNTVEGNTTFYATPAITTVKKWHDATPSDFRFTFKLPSTITHQNQLMHCDQLLADFLNAMTPLESKVGLWKIQLPANFGPDALSALKKFLQKIPKHLTYGVEVRHYAFFNKGEAEKALNGLLIEHQANRIIMDSRPVFSAPPTSEAVIDAHQNKPHVPVHAIATAMQPMIRFIGHPDNLSNDPFFDNWLTRLPKWMAEGKQPYLFIHTPDNVLAPELAIRLYQKLQQRVANSTLSLPDIALPPEPEASPQITLL